MGFRSSDKLRSRPSRHGRSHNTRYRCNMVFTVYVFRQAFISEHSSSLRKAFRIHTGRSSNINIRYRIYSRTTLQNSLGIDISLFSTIFFYAGYLMKKFNLMEKKLHIIGIAAMLLWYLAIRFNGIEMSARFYRDFPYCIFVILGAAAGSFVIFAVSSEILEQIPLISSFLIFCGKNSLTILCIHHLESYLISWTELFSNTALAGHPFRAGILIAAIRIIFDIAATKLFIIVKEKISRSYQKIRF